jgi:DnaJ family protein C protein 13
MDGVRASGNIDVHVKMTPTQRGHRLGPYYVRIDEEVESQHLKFLQTPPNNWTFNDAIVRFNANCAYSGLIHSVSQDGLFAENKEKMIYNALAAFADRENEQTETSDEHLEQHFQALRRLVASKAGFASFTANPRFRECLGLKVVKCLKRNNDNVTHSAIDMLCALMQVRLIFYILIHYNTIVYLVFTFIINFEKKVLMINVKILSVEYSFNFRLSLKVILINLIFNHYIGKEVMHLLI